MSITRMKKKTRIGVDIDPAVALVDAGHAGLLLSKYYSTAGKRVGTFFEGEHNRENAFSLCNQLFLNGVIGEELVGACPVDVGLSQRIKTINYFAGINNNCVAESLHCNASKKPEAHGSVIFYNPLRKESKRLAEYINECLDASPIDNKVRGIKRGLHLSMVRAPVIPAVLIEVGFMTNEKDRIHIIEDYKFIMGLIAEGTGAFFKNRH